MNLRRASAAIGLSVVFLSACTKKPEESGSAPTTSKTHPPPDNWMNPPLYKPQIPAPAPPPAPVPQPATLGPDGYFQAKTPADYAAVALAQYPDTVSDEQLENWVFPKIALIQNTFERDETAKRKLPEVKKMRADGKGIRGFYLDSTLPRTMSSILSHYDSQRQQFGTFGATLQVYPEFTQRISTAADEIGSPAMDLKHDNFPQWWTPSSPDQARMIEAELSKPVELSDARYPIRTYIQPITVDPTRFAVRYQLVAMVVFDPATKKPLLTIGTP